MDSSGRLHRRRRRKPKGLHQSQAHTHSLAPDGACSLALVLWQIELVPKLICISSSSFSFSTLAPSLWPRRDTIAAPQLHHKCTTNASPWPHLLLHLHLRLQSNSSACDANLMRNPISLRFSLFHFVHFVHFVQPNFDKHFPAAPKQQQAIIVRLFSLFSLRPLRPIWAHAIEVSI